jgi:DNA-binding response OmpR family regulator
VENDRKIFVVDDDPFLLDLLSRYLTKEGYYVEGAQTANEAVTKLKKSNFDIALLDVMLEGIDGLELMEKLCKLKPGLCFIVMTGHPSLETALMAMKNGAKDYLIKPFKLEHLGERIKRCYSERELQEENRRIKNELNMAQEQIKKLQAIVRQPRLSVHKGKSQTSLNYRSGEVYRVQSQEMQKSAQIEQLNRLKKMKEDGILTNEEYEGLKKQLQLKVKSSEDFPVEEV